MFHIIGKLERYAAAQIRTLVNLFSVSSFKINLLLIYLSQHNQMPLFCL
jgi:hypothetical protein